jgi:hypothetical protein
MQSQNAPRGLLALSLSLYNSDDGCSSCRKTAKSLGYLLCNVSDTSGTASNCLPFWQTSSTVVPSSIYSNLRCVHYRAVHTLTLRSVHLLSNGSLVHLSGSSPTASVRSAEASTVYHYIAQWLLRTFTVDALTFRSLKQQRHQRAAGSIYTYLWIIHGIPATISPEIKRPGSEADRSPPSNAEVGNGGAILPLPAALWPWGRLSL